MPLIPQQNKTERAHLQFRIAVNVVTDLESYCRFIESSRDFVVENALQFVFKKDREFQDWLAAGQAAGAGTPAPGASAAGLSKPPSPARPHSSVGGTAESSTR